MLGGVTAAGGGIALSAGSLLYSAGEEIVDFFDGPTGAEMRQLRAMAKHDPFLANLLD